MRVRWGKAQARCNVGVRTACVLRAGVCSSQAVGQQERVCAANKRRRPEKGNAISSAGNA